MKKKPTVTKSFRLFDFYTYDGEILERDSDDSSNDQNSEDSNTYNSYFIIQMFGINEKGETASIFVTGYYPFFYIKVGDDWEESNKTSFIGQIKYEMGKYYSDSIIGSKLIKKKTLYGFDCGKEHTFIFIKFKTEAAMRKAKGLWYISKTTKAGGYQRNLKEQGYEFEFWIYDKKKNKEVLKL